MQEKQVDNVGKIGIGLTMHCSDTCKLVFLSCSWV